MNFLCLLGWSPKDDRTCMTRQELIDAFSVGRHQSRERRGEFQGAERRGGRGAH